jgi:PGF-pre-PGF domain-containing protein
MSCSTSNASSECYIDSTNGILWLRIPHFSGVGPTIVGTTSSSSNSGGGGSTGSGGVTTSEPISNIEKAERYDKDIIASTPVTYSFNEGEHGISQIVITGKENENAITVRVESLKGTSNNAKTDAPGTVYKNLNIIVGTKKIKEAIIKFKVENSWLDKNKPAGSEIRLVKWDGSKWIQRETAEKSKDGAFTYFEAKTDSFSSFAIVAMKASEAQAVPGQTGANVTATAAGNVETTNAPFAATKETAGFEPMLAMFALCAVYLLCKKRR